MHREWTHWRALDPVIGARPSLPAHFPKIQINSRVRSDWKYVIRVKRFLFLFFLWGKMDGRWYLPTKSRDCRRILIAANIYWMFTHSVLGGGVTTSHLLQSPLRQKPRLPHIYRWGSWGTDTYFAQRYTQLSLVRFWLQPCPSWIQIIYIWEVTWPFTPRDYSEKERLGLCSLIGICFYITLVDMSSVLIYRRVKELERNSEWVECISTVCSSGLHRVLGHYMDTVVSPKSRLVFLITYPEAVPLGQGAHRVVVMGDACAGSRRTEGVQKFTPRPLPCLA